MKLDLDGPWAEVGAAGARGGQFGSADCLVHAAPIWLLPPWLPRAADAGVHRLVAFSSTSRFTKQGSGSPRERETARRLAEAEDAVQEACRRRGIRWTILRPTLVYGGGRDRNVSDVARFVARFGFFPIAGRGTGRRQPVHGADLAGGRARRPRQSRHVRPRLRHARGGDAHLRRDGVSDRASGRPDAAARPSAAASSPWHARRGELSPRPGPRHPRHGRPDGRGPGVRPRSRPTGLRLRSEAVPVPRRAHERSSAWRRTSGLAFRHRRMMSAMARMRWPHE